MLHVDATMLNCWLRCREEFRLRYIVNLAPAKPALPLIIGHATHAGIEVFWRGGSYEQAMAVGMAELDIDESLLSQPERERLQEARENLPEMLACYFDAVEYGPPQMVEREWELQYPAQDAPRWPWRPGDSPTLCGKIDRHHDGILYDVKTASEIGKTWKRDYRAMLLRDIQFALYDWYLTSIGQSPRMVVVEVIIKPYRGKPARYVQFELPEVAAYRERFKQQLDWSLREMVHYVNKYQAAKPWPMAAATICVGKYGACDFLRGCNGGWNERTMKHYIGRREHLVNIKVTACV